MIFFFMVTSSQDKQIVNHRGKNRQDTALHTLVVANCCNNWIFTGLHKIWCGFTNKKASRCPDASDQYENVVPLGIERT